MWLDLLNDAIARSNITAVARELSESNGKPVSRTTISLVVSDNYPAKTDRIQAMVENTYGKITCPYLGTEITLAVCRQHHTAAVPTSSPRAMKHWRACQNCTHRKESQ